MVRVNALVASEVATALNRRLAEDRVLATVNAVAVASDLRQATVRVSTVPDTAAAFAAVQAVALEVQQQLADRLELKRTPKLHFVHDFGPAAADKIDQLLHDV